MGRADLIGNGKHHLIPTFQPLVDGSYQSARKKNSTSSTSVKTGMGYTTNKDGKAVALRPRKVDEQALMEPKGDVRFRNKESAAQPRPGKLLTQHTGLPPRAGVRPRSSQAAKPGKPKR